MSGQTLKEIARDAAFAEFDKQDTFDPGIRAIADAVAVAVLRNLFSFIVNHRNLTRYGVEWAISDALKTFGVTLEPPPEPKPVSDLTSQTPSGSVERRTIEEAREAFIASVTLDICELPDRSSPEDDPEAMVLDAKELRLVLENNLDDLLDDLLAVQHSKEQP